MAYAPWFARHHDQAITGITAAVRGTRVAHFGENQHRIYNEDSALTTAKAYSSKGVQCPSGRACAALQSQTLTVPCSEPRASLTFMAEKDSKSLSELAHSKGNNPPQPS